MTSNAERQRAYRERKRAAAERAEFERFVADTGSSAAWCGPWTSDEDKYAAFRRHRVTAKADERRRKKAEAARERRKRRKAEADGGGGGGAVTEAVEATAAAVAESREEARRRRRAEAARLKYRRDKLARLQDGRPRPVDDSRPVATPGNVGTRDPDADDAAEGSTTLAPPENSPSVDGADDGGAACSVCGRVQPGSASFRRPRLWACRTCYRVLLDENIPRPSKCQYYRFIRYSMWLDDGDDGDGDATAKRPAPPSLPATAV